MRPIRWWLRGGGQPSRRRERGGDDRGIKHKVPQREPLATTSMRHGNDHRPADGELERQGSSSQSAQSRQTDGHQADRANWHDKRWGKRSRRGSTRSSAPGRPGLLCFSHVALAPFPCYVKDGAFLQLHNTPSLRCQQLSLNSWQQLPRKHAFRQDPHSGTEREVRQSHGQISARHESKLTCP